MSKIIISTYTQKPSTPVPVKETEIQIRLKENKIDVLL